MVSKTMFSRRKDTKEAVYKTLINSFNSEGFEFEQDDEKRNVLILFPGDDLPIHMSITVYDLHIGFMCYLPFKVSEDMHKEVAWKLNNINISLSFGAFGIDPSDGIVQFEYGYIFSNANPSKDLLLSIIAMITDTVDKYDGDLEKIAPGCKVKDQSYMFG